MEEGTDRVCNLAKTRDLSIRTYHRASATAHHFAPASSPSLPTSFTQNRSHLDIQPTLSRDLSSYHHQQTTPPHNDAHDTLLLTPNAALLRIHATAIITTIRALRKCSPTNIRVYYVVTSQREVSDATALVQGQSGDADARRHYKAKEGYVLQARPEQPG